MDAPEHPLPTAQFFGVEYPGYVSPHSIPHAIRNLGGQAVLDQVFKRSTATKEDNLIELRFKPENPFAHPIPGIINQSNNILLKIVKRRLRPRDGFQAHTGEYTVQALGAITKTARFRGMADYQYQPDMDDPVAKLRVGIDNLDVETILKYNIPPEKAEYTIPDPDFVQDEQDENLDPQLLDGPTPEPGMRSNLRLFPPPIFSRQMVPQVYLFKSNPTSIVASSIDEETGEERKRLINRMRWKGYGPATIAYAEPDIPTGPPKLVEDVRAQADAATLRRLDELFSERPIWTRAAILNQFSPLEAREILNSKILLPLVCYVFQDGPWRDTLIRFSYDPRKDSGARVYQRVYLRNVNHPIMRPSVTTRRQERIAAAAEAKDPENRLSHIFDGKNITSETAAFQLCDITDPFIKQMVDAEDVIRESCDERDGWYTGFALDRIKLLLRRKFFSLLEGVHLSDEACMELLESESSSAKKNDRLVRTSKQNRAKGALRPEDAAALRLRATLAAKVEGAKEGNR